MSQTKAELINAKGGADLGALNIDGSAPDNSINLDSSGRLLVGTSSGRTIVGINAYLQVEGSGSNYDTSAINITRNSNSDQVDCPSLSFSRSRGTNNGAVTAVTNGDRLGAIAFGGANGANLSNLGGLIECYVDGAVTGGGVNDMPGRLVFSTTADGASSPTERMRISQNGVVAINSAGTGTPLVANRGFVDLYGSASGDASYFESYAGVCAYMNRGVNDGEIIQFRQAGVQEGSISVSGTTVSYNGAHLSRWSQIIGINPHDKSDRPEILRGTVMSNLDEMCDWIDPESGKAQDNEQLNKTKVSDVEGDKNVAGIFQSWDDDDDTWVNDYYLAMTGDFIIRIGAGVTVERGDLLMSAGDGTAKPQDDDIIRSKTVAKVTSTNVTCTYDDGSYCVPCVLMAC